MLTDPNHTTIHLHFSSKRRAWLLNFDMLVYQGVQYYSPTGRQFDGALVRHM